MTYILQFKERKYYAKTLDDVLTIVGEQDGGYSIEWVEDGGGENGQDN